MQPALVAAVVSNSPQIPDRIDPPAAHSRTSSGRHESIAASSNLYGSGSRCAISAHSVVFARPSSNGPLVTSGRKGNRGDWWR